MPPGGTGRSSRHAESRVTVTVLDARGEHDDHDEAKVSGDDEPLPAVDLLPAS